MKRVFGVSVAMLAAVGLLGLATGARAATVVADYTYITNDSGVWELSPGSNYNNLSSVIVGEESGGTWYAFVRWDLSGLIGPGSVITSATLYSKPVQTSGSPTNYMISAHQVASPWSEGSITWSNKPSVSATLGSTTTTGFAEIAIDVTAAVQAWAVNPTINYGVRLSGETTPNTSINFPQRDNANWDDRKPRLEIITVGQDPDLTIQVFQLDQPTYAVGDKPDVEFWIENVGAGTAGTCCVAFVLDSPMEPAWSDPLFQPDTCFILPALAPEEDWVAVLDFDGTHMRPETIRSWAYVDWSPVTVGVVSESDEQNNVAEAAVDVVYDLAGWTQLPALVDYAPRGVPDFDQTQQLNWFPGGGCAGDSSYSFCGPTAVANVLWYLDSQNSAGVPGDGLDGVSLVRDYNAPQSGANSDDHDPMNVNDSTTCWSGSCDYPVPLPTAIPPGPFALPDSGAELIERVAYVLNTDNIRGDSECIRTGGHCGTYPCEIERYLTKSGVADVYLGHPFASGGVVATESPYPSVSQVMAVATDPTRLAVLAFEAFDQAGMRKFGHWVTLHGGIQADLDVVSVSDPFRDNAVYGGGGVATQGHPPSGLYGGDHHNDADNVSHDFYVVDTYSGGGGAWSAQIIGYASHDTQDSGLSYRISSLVEIGFGGAVAGPALPVEASAPGRWLAISPNPSRGTAVVQFSTRAAGSVDIAVYDVAGRLVRRLAREYQDGGARRIVWNGRNHEGMPVAAGRYFVRLRDREGVLLKSVSMIR